MRQKLNPKELIPWALGGIPLGISISFMNQLIEDYKMKVRIKRYERCSRNRVLSGEI